MSIKAVILANDKCILGQYIKTEAINNYIPNLLSNLDFTKDDDIVIERTGKTQNFCVHYKIVNGIVFIVVYDAKHRLVEEMIEDLIGKYNDGILYNKSKKFYSKIFEEMINHYEITIKDRSEQIDRKITLVSNIMKDNIELLQAKTENTENIVAHTEKLEAKTKDFEKAAKSARCRTCIDLLMCCGILRCCFDCIRCK